MMLNVMLNDQCDAAQLMLQDLALTLRSTGAAEEIEVIEAERDKLAAVRFWWFGPLQTAMAHHDDWVSNTCTCATGKTGIQ